MCNGCAAQTMTNKYNSREVKLHYIIIYGIDPIFTSRGIPFCLFDSNKMITGIFKVGLPMLRS